MNAFILSSSNFSGSIRRSSGSFVGMPLTMVANVDTGGPPAGCGHWHRSSVKQARPRYLETSTVFYPALLEMTANPIQCDAHRVLPVTYRDAGGPRVMITLRFTGNKGDT